MICSPGFNFHGARSETADVDFFGPVTDCRSRDRDQLTDATETEYELQPPRSPPAKGASQTSEPLLPMSDLRSLKRGYAGSLCL